jgi:hypothetical protein
VPPGKHQVRAEFAYDGGGIGKDGNVSLYYHGNQVGEGRVETTQPCIFSSDEGLDIGCETGTAVAPECDVQSSEFSGEINWIELKVGEYDNGHLVDPEDYIKVLIAWHCCSPTSPSGRLRSSGRCSPRLTPRSGRLW